jgi:hypothetical protein
MAKLIEEETLDRMFKDDVGKGHLKKPGRCHCCGSDVAIIIERTNRGYGFQGGVLYESNTGQFHMQCERCFKNIGHSNHLGDAG